MTDKEKFERWLVLHVQELVDHNLNDDEAYEHDQLEADLVEVGLLDDSGPQTFVVERTL